MSRSSDEVGMISRRRFMGVAGGILAGGVAVSLCRVIFMRLSPWPDYPESSEWPPASTLVIPYHRAHILDIHGEPLAETKNFFGIYSIRSQLMQMNDDDLEMTLDKLADILGRQREDFSPLLDQSHSVVWIERPLSPAQLARLDEFVTNGGILYGFRKQRIFTRAYRHHPAGAAVIGYVFQKLIPNKEPLGHCHHEADQWTKGLEKAFYNRLEGNTGSVTVPVDKLNRFLMHETTAVEPAEPGEPIQVALDIKLQKKVEEIIESHRKAWSAEIALATVARADDGNLLCVARMPQGPPDQPCWKWDESLSNCENIIGSYCLGSVMKPLFYAGAIENGVVGPEELIPVPPVIRISGKAFLNRKIFPSHMSVTDCLVHSVMTGSISITQRLERHIGREGIFQLLKGFGIGEKIDLPFPHESGGLLPAVLKRSSLSIAEACIGYELEFNHITLIRAFSCIAGKGRSVLPRLLIAQGTQGGMMSPLPVRREAGPISAGTADAILRILEEAIGRGTGREAAIEGVKLAGKTGTARAYRPKPPKRDGAPPPTGPFGFLHDRRHCTFIGILERAHIIAVSFLFVPVPCPACSEAGNKDQRTGQCQHVYASQVACPAFRDVGQLLV